MSNNIEIWHHDDADGRSSARIVANREKCYNKKCFVELDYTDPLPFNRLSKDKTVYIVDYSFKESTYKDLQKIIKMSKDVIWIDHHQSSVQLIEEHPELDELRGIVMNGISGAGLSYMYCNGIFDLKDCPLFIRYISDFDTFTFKLGQDSKYFILGLQTNEYGPLDKIWEQLEKDTKNELVLELIEKGKIIEKYRQEENKDYLKKYSFETTFDGKKTLVINIRSFSDIFGDKINDYDFVLLFWFDGKLFNHSIYSNKPDIDCSKIAAKYGGGGHKGAAGFTSDKMIIKGGK